MLYLVLIYFCLFTYLAYKKFPWAVYLFLLTLPAYLIRLNFGPLPSTLLEVSFFALVIGWISTITKEDVNKLKQDIQTHKVFFTFVGGVLVFSFISIFTSMIGADNSSQKFIYGLGEWRALFFEPIVLFIILLTKREKLEEKKLTLSLLGAALFISVIALIQKFTGQLFPPSLWDDQLFGRVTSIFTSANAIGLFTAPVVFLSLLVVKKKKIVVLVGIALLLLANLFSISQGAWIAIGAGILAYIFTVGYKKLAISLAVLGMIGGLLLPSMREAVLFQDKAGQNRVFVWEHTMDYLTETPKNFILGTGIRNFFDAIQKPIYNPKTLEALKYPHNIVLNFWTESGLFGMISIVGVIVCLFISAFRIEDRQKRAALVAALTVLIVHGLVDVPYFKNDLAMLFWTLVFLVSVHEIQKQRKINQSSPS